MSQQDHQSTYKSIMVFLVVVIVGLAVALVYVVAGQKNSDDMANIKKLTKRVYDYALISESTDMDSYPPIIIHEDDDYLINGQVIAVVKS